MSVHRRVGVAVATVVTLAACGGEKAQQAAEGGAEAAPAAEMQPSEMEQAAAAPQQLPAGVTPQMIAQGKEIFTGPGICATCHGPDGKGVPNLGANLTDSEWVHSDGSYEAIVNTILSGVPAEKSTTGTPMPPKGGSTITDAQVKAAAAYVWSLSHGG
jgi:mono/diheme cytochrome c family protein